MEQLGWDRLYKGSNPRGNLELSDYRRERAAEAAKDAELELEAVMDRIASAQTTIQVRAEQMEAMQKTLEKGVEAEQRLNGRIAVKSVELDVVTQDLTDKKNEVEEQTRTWKRMQIRRKRERHW